MKRLLVFVSGVAATLSLPAVALAENMSSTPSKGTVAQQAVVSSGVAPSGSLPFTGVNLALMLVLGIALVATGLLLRRRSQHT
jgi:LPXTG-motif cell wall-anchored protein